MQISGSDIDSQEETKRIDENVAFAPLQAFVRIEPADPSRFLNGLDALRRHHPGLCVEVRPFQRGKNEEILQAYVVPLIQNTAFQTGGNDYACS
jgi:hypothetical protein